MKYYASLSKPITPETIGFMEYDAQTFANRNVLFAQDTEARLNKALLGRWVTHIQDYSVMYYQITRVYTNSVEVRRCYGVGHNDALDSDWGDRTSIDIRDARTLINSRDALRVEVGVVL